MKARAPARTVTARLEQATGPVECCCRRALETSRTASFTKKRNDGELFWVVKNGSPGTGMPALVKGNVLTEEEAWTIIAYERTFCKDTE